MHRVISTIIRILRMMLVATMSIAGIRTVTTAMTTGRIRAMTTAMIVMISVGISRISVDLAIAHANRCQDRQRFCLVRRAVMASAQIPSAYDLASR